MRPILTAIAALLILCAPAAAEDRIDWSLYGTAILSADWADDGGAGSFYLSSHNSRLGFKGDYDLGNGLAAIWQIETRINFDDASDIIAARNTYAGIRGPFGSIKLGRHDTPFKEACTKSDPFVNITGESRNIVGLRARFNIRTGNMIRYDSPLVKGIRLSALYRAPEETKGEDLISGGLEYRVHGLNLRAAAEMHGRALSAIGDTLSDGDREFGIRVSGIWQRSALELFGLIESLRDVGGVCGADVLTWSAGASLDVTGKAALTAKFIRTGGIETESDSGASLIAGMVDYAFTERTLAFFAGAVTLNGESASYTSNGVGLWKQVTPVEGTDPWTVSLGLQVDF